MISSNQLLKESIQASLYPKLIAQLQKDLNRAGIFYDLEEGIKPEELFASLHNLLVDKLRSSFNEYLNLLYAVDVSEAQIRSFKSENATEIAAHSAYLILKREWQKVYYKNQF